MRSRFQKSRPEDPRISSEVQIFVENLPKSVKIPELCQYFSSVGTIKMDRMTRRPRVWLYHDKRTGEPTGECTITYSDTPTQERALSTYDSQIFQGRTIRVTPSIVKAHMAKPAPPPVRGGGRGRGRGRDGGRGRPARGNERAGKRKGENIIDLAKKFKFVSGDSQAGTFQPNRSYAATGQVQQQQPQQHGGRTYEKEWAAYYASLGYHTSASAQYSQNQWQGAYSQSRR